MNINVRGIVTKIPNAVRWLAHRKEIFTFLVDFIVAISDKKLTNDEIERLLSEGMAMLEAIGRQDVNESIETKINKQWGVTD